MELRKVSVVDSMVYPENPFYSDLLTVAIVTSVEHIIDFCRPALQEDVMCRGYKRDTCCTLSSCFSDLMQ